MRVSTKHVFPFQYRITYCLFNSIFPFVYVTHALLEVYISDKGKEDSDDGIYTSRISHTSSKLAKLSGGFSLARGQMNSKLKRKRKTFLAQGKSLTSAEFGDFASYSLLLFSMWSRVFVFVCILTVIFREL